MWRKLKQQHPDAHCELDHRNPYELVVATVLSAQTTDQRVNLTTPALFNRFPDAQTLAEADVERVADLLAAGGLGFFRVKARNITTLAKQLVDRHGGVVPKKMGDLVKLTGVGRKTANLVLGVCFGRPEGVVVDTHVMRVTQRLGWTKNTEPEPIEADIGALFSRRVYDRLSHTLIFHGRRVCSAQKPSCADCLVNRSCPSAFNAEHVGRKPRRARS